MLNSFISFHKKQINWFKEKVKISDYGILWFAWIKGLLIGLLVYHFLL